MKRNIFYYILPLFAIFVISCTDEYLNGGNPNSSTEGSNLLSLEIDIPEMRTRAIDMSPGAAIYLNDIWVGVYRKGNKNRVGGTPGNKPIDLKHRLTASGAQLIDLVQIEGCGENTMRSGVDVLVVGVANCYDTQTADGESLADVLEKADTWDKFIEIAINTQQEFIANTPVLMGYLQPTNSDNTEAEYIYTQINQMIDGSTGIELSGSTIGTGGATDNNIWVKCTGVDNSGGTDSQGNQLGVLTSIRTQNSLLKLRRLRSKINVNITSRENLYVTNVQYKVMNSPKSSFLAERRTNTFTGDANGKIDFKYSANSADVKEHGYFDEDWVTPRENSNFSYEHFENKHWALPDAALGDYHARELHTGNPLSLDNTDKPVFNVLANSTTDWNNNASYMIIRMEIRDENTGRNAKVDYIVHEGFINTEYGQATNIQSTRLKDFTCIRNTDYYYNIHVVSVDNIVTQVSTNQNHQTDQSGQVWDLDYVKEDNTSLNQVIVNDGDSKEIKKDIHFGPNADIAFRLIGNWGSEHKGFDACYNFKRGELDGFAGIWTAPSNENTEYLVEIGHEGEDTHRTAFEMMGSYFDSYSSDEQVKDLLNGIKVKVKDQIEFWTIRQYINYIEALRDKYADEHNGSYKDWNTDGKIDIVAFKFEKMDESTENVSNPNDYLRGLYIFDRDDAIFGNINRDDDGCILYKIYAAEQLPIHKRKISFTANDMIWTGQIYNILDGDDLHWCGGRDVVTEMFWKHKEGITGYKVQVRELDPTKGKEFKDEVVEITKEELENYIIDNPARPGEKIISCPFPTKRYSLQYSPYTVVITPIVENTNDYIAPDRLELEGAMTIKENQVDNSTVWDFASSPWIDLSRNWFRQRNNVIYNGLVINHKMLPESDRFPKDCIDENNVKPDPEENPSKYVQFGTSGEIDDNNIRLYLHQEGKLTVSASNTGNNSGRYITLYKEGSNYTKEIVEQKPLNNSASSEDYEFTITTTTPTKYYVTFTDGNSNLVNGRFYKVKFIRKG